jgi:hypothetical protein
MQISAISHRGEGGLLLQKQVYSMGYGKTFSHDVSRLFTISYL